MALAGSNSRPKVRAITAFIDIDAHGYESQIGEAMRFLTAARHAYGKAGFEVETIRITTQPFPNYTKGMKRGDAIAFLRKLDALAAKLEFDPNIGPAMLADRD